jgi:hypothetical protein
MNNNANIIEKFKPVLNEVRKAWIKSLKVGDQVLLTEIDAQKSRIEQHLATVATVAQKRISISFVRKKDGRVLKRQIDAYTGTTGGTKTNPFDITYISPLEEIENTTVAMTNPIAEPSNDFKVWESHGMIIFEGVIVIDSVHGEKERHFSYGVSINDVKSIESDRDFISLLDSIDYATDGDYDKDYKNVVQKVGKKTAFAIEITGLGRPLEQIKYCLGREYAKIENTTFYYFYGEGEKVLLEFYGLR